ncbi:hypothetical protein [Mycobacterium sp. RTGN5]|uniref:hypothetical protein n=1 Tax=Mycobacterium sp. RTGN5 TaxID=3016522 RepID=UPI0029C7C276|nr:hypothetical protein [Mycobacterium sp. RTGN5]
MTGNAHLPVLQRLIGMTRGVDATLQDPWIMPSANDAVKFDIQVAADIAWDRVQKTGVVEADSGGVLTPPYPLLWMECSNEDRNEHIVAVVESDDNRLLSMRFIALNEVDMVAFTYRVAPVVAMVEIDAAGNFLGWYPEGGEEISDDIIDLTNKVIGVVTVALSLVNCRNVKTPESGQIKMARSGAEKRRGQVARVIRYHTIVLPGGGTESDARTGRQRATAVHRVRGHFKTFTEERPLMGKHVGTYWWGWQVRGDSARGVIDSDYLLGES